MVQCGGITAANIYRNDDKPLYKRRNRVLIGINVLSISLFLFAKAYYVTKNKIRDRKWNALTLEVRIDPLIAPDKRLLTKSIRSKENTLVLRQILQVAGWTFALHIKDLATWTCRHSKFSVLCCRSQKNSILNRVVTLPWCRGVEDSHFWLGVTNLSIGSAKKSYPNARSQCGVRYINRWLKLDVLKACTLIVSNQHKGGF